VRNLRLLLEYDGSRYHGWQRQKNALTIQEVVESALARLTGENVRLIGSGRTDAGVHARGQVANFRTSSHLPLRAFVSGLNSLLPLDIAVLEAREVPPDFHARYSARAKTYQYHILNRPQRSPLQQAWVWWLPQPLKLELMQEAAAMVVGEHDFGAFRCRGSCSGSPRRRVLAANWQRQSDSLLTFTITANGFLRGMVRSLVGTMVEVGRGKRPLSDMQALLQGSDRSQAGPTAPAQGLVLVGVVY